MPTNRILGLLGMIGGLAASALVAVFAMTDFGLPGTAAYRTYEMLNRLIALPLLLMACGWLLSPLSPWQSAQPPNSGYSPTNLMGSGPTAE